MDLLGKILSVIPVALKQVKITFLIDEVNLPDFDKYINEDHLTIEINKYREARSKDANSYCWVLCDKLAKVLGKNKDEIYEEEICKYGHFVHVIVNPKAVEELKRNWRGTKELGEVEVNGRKGIQVQCYYGSSTYDTLQMACLLDGIVNDCKELDIETRTPTELEDMKRSWKNAK